MSGAGDASGLVTVDGPREDAAAGLWGRILDLAEGLGADDWVRATPCAGWDVKDLFGHLSGTQTAFDGSGPQPSPPEGWAPPPGLAKLDHWTEAAVAARRPWDPGQVLEELRVAAAGHQARLRAVTDWSASTVGPTGPTTEQALFDVRCFDLWVHLQDLHAALGRPIDTRDGSPAAMANYRFLLSRTPWMFAKPVGAPEGARMRLELTAPVDAAAALVRRDGRAAFDGETTAVDGVTAAPGVFALLVTGRGDPDTWRADGLLDWDGDLGARFVERARMFG